MRQLLWAFIFLLSNVAWGQSTDKYNSDYADFYRGEELFLKKQYAAARKEFHDFILNFEGKNDPFYVKAKYYEGISAIELYQNDAVDMLEDFNKEYPESIYKNDIFFRLGKYYYQKKKYNKVIEWYNQMEVVDIDSTRLDEYHFKLGYSYYEEGQMTEARNSFHEVKDGTSQYSGPSLYYYSHIAYENESYQVALDGFEKLKTDPKFEKIVPFYIAQIYYLQGRYAEVPQFAAILKAEAEVANEAEINLLIGDSYYKLGKYKESIPYLEQYDQKAETSRANDYQLGNAYFKSKVYDKAVKLLDRTTRVKDTMAQFAYYQIGQSYLGLDQPIPARAAFEQAADMDFKPNIAEDALYQFAILSYKLDLNPYDEAVIALEYYLLKYPNSSRKEDVYQYLVNVYTTTNNYTKALQSLDRLPNKDIQLKSAYQLIAFNAGVEQYQKANYDDAIRLFGLVDKYPMKAEISGKGKFWSADAKYQKKKYRQAIQGYRVFLSASGASNKHLRADAYYNLGYANLKIKDTVKAIEDFTLYTQQSGLYDKTKLADAYMRIADGHYSLRTSPKNVQAIAAYKSALSQNAGYQDQALFYMGKSYGYSGELDKEITAHKKILSKYPNSKYVPASIEEIAVTYKYQTNYDQALIYFNKIINDYPSSNSVKNAMVEIADIYYKKGDFNRAEKEYKNVLALYSSDRKVCESAGRNLAEVYKALRQQEKLQSIMEQYPCANIDPDDVEYLFYEPANKAFSDSNYTSAIPQIQKYLDKYPNGKYTGELEVFMAKSLEETGNISESINWYKKTLARPNTAYTEYAAVKVSKYLFNNGDYSEALPFYKKLESVTSDPQVIYNAQLGIMRSSYLTEQWTDAVTYAEKILSGSEVNPSIKMEAEYIKAFGSYQMADFDKAQVSLNWIADNNTKIMGSEAKFTLAESYFKQANYTKAKEHISEFYKRKPSYDFYVAKTLILETRIFMELDDLVQAEQKLKSVRDNYPFQDDGILEEADALWDNLMILKNQPKDIEDGKKPIIELEDGN